MKRLNNLISQIHYKELLALCCLVILLTMCADPNRKYSPEMKHSDPGIEFLGFVDMYRSPSYEIYSTNPNFADGMTARKPPEGTIARGYMPYIFPNTREGYEAAGDNLKNPVPLTPEIVTSGRDLFTKFCAHCHGLEGLGDGTMVKNGKFPPPPSFTTGFSSGGGRLRDLPEGKIFHSITYGKNLMGPHASQLDKEERWKIVHFVQTLQYQMDEPEPVQAEEPVDEARK